MTTLDQRLTELQSALDATRRDMADVERMLNATATLAIYSRADRPSAPRCPTADRYQFDGHKFICGGN
jgi:hypothetical protein